MAHKASRAFVGLVTAAYSSPFPVLLLPKRVPGSCGACRAQDGFHPALASTSVTRTPGTDKASPRVIEGRPSEDRVGARAAAVSAAAVTSLAAVCGVVAFAFDVVESTQGAAPGPGVTSAAVVAAASSVAVALMAVVAGLVRPALSGALTAGYGAVAVGLTVLDVGLVGSPIDANRLELFRPTTAEALTPGIGAYLVIASHGFAVLGGLIGLRAIDRASFDDGYGHSARPDMAGRASASKIGPLLSVVAVAAALVAATAMFTAPYSSTDSVVLVSAVVQSVWSTAIGSGLVALAVLVVVAAALASISPSVATGAVVGSGMGVLGLFAGRVVAGAASGPGIDSSVGSASGAVGALVLVAAGVLVLPAAALRERHAVRDAEASPRTPVATNGHVMRWHVSAGVCGVVSGVFLVGGGLLPVLTVPDGLPNPIILAGRVAAIAAVLVVLASVPMFFSLFAATVRPALGIVAVAAAMAGAGVLQSVVLATDIDGIAVGPGGISTVIGVLAALACGGATMVAGSAERDDVDTSDLPLHRPTAILAFTGAVLGAAGLALPLYRGSDGTAASIFEIPWGWDVWGRMAVAVALLASAAVAGRARPARGAALLAGGATAMVVYLLGWPLTAARIADSSVDLGVFFGAAGTAVLAAAAVVSARRRR